MGFLWKWIGKFCSCSNDDKPLSDLWNAVVCGLKNSIFDFKPKTAQLRSDYVDYQFIAFCPSLNQIGNIFHNHDFRLQQTTNPNEFFKKGVSWVFVISTIFVAY